MFTNHYLETVDRVLRENCNPVSGTTRKRLAEILVEEFSSDFGVQDHVMALTILVPSYFSGYHNKVGRGGGIVANPPPVAGDAAGEYDAED
jgi:hypothetical protein